MNQTECKCNIVFFLSFVNASPMQMTQMPSQFNGFKFNFSISLLHHSSLLMRVLLLSFEMASIGFYSIPNAQFWLVCSETSFIDLRSLIQSTTTIEMAVHKSCALIRLKFPHQITKEITNCHKSSYYMKNVQLSISTHLHVHFTRLST